MDASGSMKDSVTPLMSWTDCKSSVPTLQSAFAQEMNKGGLSGKTKFGIVRWSSADLVEEVRALTMTDDNATALNDAFRGMSTPTGGTYYGPPLCKCYSMLMSDPDVLNKGFSKMCILVSDGGNSDQNINYANDVDCATNLREDWAASAGTWTGKASTMTLPQIADFLKYKNITIFSMLIGDQGAGANMYRASTCDHDTETHTSNTCNYYKYFDGFDGISAAAANIAATQRTAAIVVEQSSVSICSLDFLYALLAFLPLLGCVPSSSKHRHPNNPNCG